ncbi:xanthine dehydrogenase family protein molybdopterin-binding subunit [Acidobacteria bacterium AH-259-D05]|nr:xanthine dehydrogenase family protein molybdopterin-binding subunit [Acidobacteria bacterium AH-259-D05]
MVEKLNTVGTATPRVDGLQRVTGRATYSADVRLPDMLYARVLRSPHPHARIGSIDVSKALATPGVKAVLSRENCEIVWSSGDRVNKRYLFNNPVRFVGDPVAAVAATDRHLAEEALKLIQVEYEPLDFSLSAEEALEPGAVEIQPGGNLSPVISFRSTGPGKREPATYVRGDVEKGFAESDHIFEDHYVSKHINNAQMEPRVAVAQWEGDKLTVWTPTQGISNCHRDIATSLNLPAEKVRVICHYMGGGFGNKNQCQDSDLMAAQLARETGQPVKLELTRKEDFVCVHGRWPTSQYYKIGAKKDGSLQAIQLRGYSGMGPYRKSSGDVGGIDFYSCPNIKKEVYPAYTNTAVGANFRGPPYPQGVFGLGSMMDHIAHQLKIDPVEFHLKNFTRQYQDKTPYTSSGLAECIGRGAELFEWKKRWHPAGSDPGPIKKGVGMAIGGFGSGVGRSSAVLRLDSEGTLWVHVGVTDIGTGAKTTMALIAAEAVGVDIDKVQMVSGDTDRCPYSVGESGSRTTTQTGWAILEAAKDLKQQLETNGPPQGDAVFIAEATPEPRLRGVSRRAFTAHFVEVEVDTELGDIRPLKYVAMHDSGRIINPLTAASQIKGGVIQGIGMALHEELIYDQNTGIPINPGYYGARIMTHMDAPDVEVHFIETEDAHGPYGAKAVGEPPIVPVVGAVANAVFNAIGKRIKELPITRDKIIGVAS